MASDYSGILSMFDPSGKPRREMERMALIRDDSDGTYAIMVVSDEIEGYMDRNDPAGAIRDGAVKMLGYLLDGDSAMEFAEILGCIASGGAEMFFEEG